VQQNDADDYAGLAESKEPMSKYREELERAKRRGKLPTGVVLAFGEEQPINVVILGGHLRYRLVRAITRDEFMAQLIENRKHQECVCAEAWAEGARIEVSTAKDQPEPGPEFTHFYAAECV
jgi:ribosomal protein L18